MRTMVYSEIARHDVPTARTSVVRVRELGRVREHGAGDTRREFVERRRAFLLR
jgi:hypothetical protein